MSWVYYQTVEDSRQTWQVAAVETIGALAERVYHLSIYQLDKTPDEAKQEEIRYEGDLWFDIDHKPSAGETQDDALQRSIADLKRLIEYFKSIQLDIAFLEFFATGRKGFHVRVPSRIFGGNGKYKFLPLVHKYMAYAIENYAGLEGMDGSLYCLGKGKMLRTPNMPRSNGKYKVPIPADVIKDIELNLYHYYVNEPRAEGLLSPETKYPSNASLSLLFSEARTDVAESQQARETPVDLDSLLGFEDKPPQCIDWIVTHRNIKDVPGKFNGAKMGLARFLGVMGLTNGQHHPLIDQFAQNWESDRNPTFESKVKAVQYALKYGKEQGFSCQKILLSLSNNPCRGCPVQAEKYQQIAEAGGVIEQAAGYFKPGARNTMTLLCNFTMRPTLCFISDQADDQDSGHEFDIFINMIPEGGKASHKITLDPEAWNNSAQFKKRINRHRFLSWEGGDTDLQRLRSFLTSDPMVQGIPKMRVVRTIGIYKHIDNTRGISEYVWVQPGWSVNAAGVADTVKYDGPNQEFGGTLRTISLDFQQIKPMQTKETVDIYLKLLEVNSPEIVAVTAGWMAACWLKPHLCQGRTELHFPLLELCGPATSGKTLTAKMFSLLAGADYSGVGVLTASTATPFTFKTEASMSTSVPRIFDEVNSHKMPRHRYSEIIELFKAAASGGLLMQGRLSTNRNGAVTDSRPASSPIIFCATQHNPIKEIQERSVTLQLSTKTRKGRDIYPVDRGRKHLNPIAKQLMQAALNTTEDWVIHTMEECVNLMPSNCTDRLLRNYQVVVTGLKFLYKTLADNNYPVEVLARTLKMQEDVLAYLRGPVVEERAGATQQEIDVILDDITQLAMSTGRGEPRLIQHIHYVVEGHVIHLNGVMCFSEYLRHMAELRKLPELETFEQMHKLLKHTDYYVGAGLRVDALVPSDWITLNLEYMREHGIVVGRFPGVTEVAGR